MIAYTPSAIYDLSNTIKNGIYYTPENVAFELLLGLKQYVDVSATLSILDPACGDGALLRAAKKTLGSMHVFHGCDLFTPGELVWDDAINFYEGDFFEYAPDELHHIVVSNPPYIQFGRLDGQRRSNLYRGLPEELSLRKTVDLWVYFLIKSLSHLREGGAFSAVIPWSFLEAEFSHVFRRWLATKFRSIRVLVLRDRHFSTTNKRVLLLWMAGYGQNAENIELGFSGRVDDDHKYQPITIQEWSTTSLLADPGGVGTTVLNDCQKKGWFKLEDVAAINIGVVTGANSYFIQPRGTNHYSKKLPILTRVNDLNTLELHYSPENELLILDKKNALDSKYIKDGIEAGIQERSHCKRRSERWYRVNVGDVPDAFFTYRVSNIPYLALNPRGFQCTNALHKVVFKKKLSDSKRKWIAIFMLSDITQLSLELRGRHYGSGILKVEPSALKGALIYIPAQRVSLHRFNKISKLVSAGNKEAAAQEATAYCMEVSGLPKSVWERAHIALGEIRSRRK